MTVTAESPPTEAHDIVLSTSSARDVDGVDAPAWLRAVACMLATAVLSFGAVGLVLAINGWFSGWLAFPIGAACTVLLLALMRPAYARAPRRVRTRGRSANLAAVAGLVLIGAVTLWNGAHASEHVLINRDGGAYENAGRWISRTGGLNVKARVGPFATEPSLSFESAAVYETKNGDLQFQFGHFLPALLAEGRELGGDSMMFHVPELLSGVALLSFFVMAWRVFRRPWFAVIATLVFAFVLPQVSFSRDSYSEIPSEVLVFTAIWLLTSERVQPHWRVALGAGLFLGVAESARIDALAHLIGVPVLFAVWWLTRAREGVTGRAVKRAMAAFGAGVLAGLALGFVDLIRHSGDYFSDLSTQVVQLIAATVLTSALLLGIVLLWPRLARALSRDRLRVLANATAIAVAACGLALWVLRPVVQKVHGSNLPIIAGMQHAERVAIDGTRRYFELSMTWMSWYLGPVTLLAAIVGAALLVRALMMGRYVRAVPVVCILVPEALIYLWKANAVPDHAWVARRFLPATIPALVLLAIGFAAFAIRYRGRRGANPLLRVAGVGVVLLAVAYPIYTVVPVAAMTEQRGFLKPLLDACHEIGPHAAVVILDAESDHLYLDKWAPQSLRGWCGADVALMPGDHDAATLRRLAAEWNEHGRPLFVMASAPETIRQVLPAARIVRTRVSVNKNLLLPTLTHRPDKLGPQRFWTLVARVPAGNGG